MTDKAKPDDPAQSQRFIDMAHEVEAPDCPGTFDDVFQKVVQSPAGRRPPKDHAGET